MQQHELEHVKFQLAVRGGNMCPIKVVKHEGSFSSLELFETRLGHGPEQPPLSGPALRRNGRGAGQSRGCLCRAGLETSGLVLLLGLEQKPTENKAEEEEASPPPAPPDGTTQCFSYLTFNAVVSQVPSHGSGQQGRKPGCVCVSSPLPHLPAPRPYPHLPWERQGQKQNPSAGSKRDLSVEHRRVEHGCWQRSVLEMGMHGGAPRNAGRPREQSPAPTNPRHPLNRTAILLNY